MILQFAERKMTMVIKMQWHKMRRKITLGKGREKQKRKEKINKK